MKKIIVIAAAFAAVICASGCHHGHHNDKHEGKHPAHQKGRPGHPPANHRMPPPPVR